uniref:Uncharacterized protein n=1 Tax=Virus NIOZ-UU157 TaxID=2763269 RepID=A0A7S9XDM9_9VIRU|nr:MAG: hypothetical protein NIOZUU157_00019 [Virus NIOZ-UU157]
MNRAKYMGDARYERVLERMDLLGIMDVSTTRQARNGTIVWRLPIKNNWKNGKLIEVASFSTGYVRNQNSGYSNYQLNKRCEGEPEYFDSGRLDELGRPMYTKFTTRSCKLIPIEIDRLEYLISYCLKNYFIKRANEVADGKLIPKWTHEWELEKIKRECNQAYDCGLSDAKTKASELDDRIYELESQVEVADRKLAETKVRQDVSVIVNGHRYKVI